MKEQMSKTRLLEQMRGERARLEALVGGIDEAQMESAPAPSEWSVKDVLAHISAWERHFLGWFEAEAKGKEPRWPVPPVTKEDVERFNAQVYAARRDWPLADVRAESHASFRALLAGVETLPEAELLAPDRFAFAIGRPAWFFFTLAVARHYPQHYGQIQTAAQSAYRGAVTHAMGQTPGEV